MILGIAKASRCDFNIEYYANKLRPFSQFLYFLVLCVARFFFAHSTLDFLAPVILCDGYQTLVINNKTTTTTISVDDGNAMMQ